MPIPTVVGKVSSAVLKWRKYHIRNKYFSFGINISLRKADNSALQMFLSEYDTLSRKMEK